MRLRGGRVIAAALARIDGLTVLDGEERLRPYETDGFIQRRALPLCAALPARAGAVSAALRTCAAAGVPVVTRGAGTGISGGAIPHERGVLLVMTRMNAVHALDAVARTATVGPGLRNLAVSEAAAPHGLFFAPDPSSQIVSSVGGNVAENAGGVHCVKYGLTVHNVLALDLVLSDGEVAHLGSRALDAAGYDLMALAIGSEGLLGVVTQICVKLVALPDAVETLLAAFDAVKDAADAVGAIIAAGLTPAALEMMDAKVIEACERFMAAGFPAGAGALLLVEFDGAAAEVADDVARAKALLASHGARQIRAARDEAERARLWRARKGAFAALTAIKPDYYTVDGTIPRRELAHVLECYERMAAAAGLMVANVFHAGDGNLHPCIFYDAAKPGDCERAEELGGRMLELCVEVGGTITGEHGVGVEKLKQMCVQFRDPELAMFHAIKAAFDPAGILNPGKGIPELKRCAEWGGMHVRGGTVPHADIPRF
jgi:glycolate oxidase